MFKNKENMTTSSLLKKIANEGLTAYSKNENSIIISYGYYDIELDGVITREAAYFIGETPFMIYEKVVNWMNNKSLWEDKNLILKYPECLDFDLEYSLYELGFKYVDIVMEDTNFVAVDCRFCYINEDNEFMYDGVLQFDNVGDKFITLQYIKDWIKDYSMLYPGNVFKATKNRL